jgi:hypothetical protein
MPRRAGTSGAQAPTVGCPQAPSSIAIRSSPSGARRLEAARRAGRRPVVAGGRDAVPMARCGRSRHPVSRRGTPAGRGKRRSHRSPARDAEGRRRRDAAGPAQRADRRLAVYRHDARAANVLPGSPAARRSPLAGSRSCPRSYRPTSRHALRAGRPGGSQPRWRDLGAASRESPFSPDLGEPGDGVRERLRGDPVADVASIALALQRASPRQRVEVLNDSLARDRQFPGELSRGRWSMGGPR